MQNWTALYCPEVSEGAACRKVLFVLNIDDSGERQCDCWWRYKCITVVNNLYVHQMILQSSTPPVTVCTHMMTANSTWCLRTISCIFYLPKWESKWTICSTETKCWVSWEVAYFKIRPHQLVYTENLSVCLSLSGNEMKIDMNQNFHTMMGEIGKQLFDSYGLIIHRIFSHAATIVPYRDIFNDTEWGCQYVNAVKQTVW